MTNFTIEVDDLALEFSERHLIVAPSEFNDGRHLRIDWEPQPSGKYVGLYTPHVTFPTRPPPTRRRTIGRFTAEQLRAAMSTLTTELSILWSSASRPTTPAELAAEDWLVVGFGNEAEELLRQYFLSGTTFRFPDHPDELNEIFDRMLEHAVDPRELDSAKQHGPYQLVRARDELLETAMVGHFARGLFGPPGWYITPLDDLAHQIIRAAMSRCLSPAMVGALMKVAQYFGWQPSEELRSLALRAAPARTA